MSPQAPSPQGPKPQGPVAEKFFGAWRYVGTTIDDKPRPGRGSDPKGLIMYDRSGYMTAYVAADQSRWPMGAELSPDEASEMLSNCVAYYGTFSIDEAARTVTHHREANVRPGDGGDVVRGYEFTGNRLILRPVGTTQAVIWERIA